MFAELTLLFSSSEGAALFRQALPYALAGTAGVMVLYLLVAMVFRGGAKDHATWNLWDGLIYLGLIGSVGILGATSIFAVIRSGELDGWLLFAHMCGAGALTAVLPLLALSWAGANRFRSRSGSDAATTKFFWLPKLMFWLLLAAGLVVTLTMLISMLPIYGTDGLRTLLDIHRFSGLAVVAFVLLHLFGVILQKLGLR